MTQSKIDQKVKEIIYYMEMTQNRNTHYNEKFSTIKDIITDKR